MEFREFRPLTHTVGCDCQQFIALGSKLHRDNRIALAERNSLDTVGISSRNTNRPL